MNQQELENIYLKAKIAYYEGNDIMTDAEFDAIEVQLKDLGSKVIEQVGSKRKDFDLTHPTKMLSLAKIQMSKGDYMTKEFYAWYQKRVNNLLSLGNFWNEKLFEIQLEFTPKYDGNAINIIYHNGVITDILTRGSGISGKDVTNKLKHIVQIGLEISKQNPNNTYEIRCEVVMPLSSFEKLNREKANRGEQEFANARNFVAGLLGKDDVELDIINQLKIVPLHILENGKHISLDILTDQPLIIKNLVTNYETAIKYFENIREKFEFGLDGVVISFPAEYRYALGENSHDPEWGISVKFVPDQVITSVDGIEWNVSKTGELNPVILLDPVILAGTIVKRASGYNAGFILNNKLGLGARVEIAKAGEIIPEVIKIITGSTQDVELPKACPICRYPTLFDGIHLLCTNDECEGKMLKRLGIGLGVFDIKGVGGRTIVPFVGHFENFVELFIWIRKNEDNPLIFEEFGFKVTSRSFENFIQSFKNIKSISLAKIIQALGYDEVGNSISPELAKWYSGIETDFKGFEKAVVGKMIHPDMAIYIEGLRAQFHDLGIDVEIPKKLAPLPLNVIFIEMTGSPKPTWKTKEEFISLFTNVEHVSLSDKRCNYLVTDSIDSTSGKMGVAAKKGIEILSYEDFYSQLNDV